MPLAMGHAGGQVLKLRGPQDLWYAARGLLRHRGEVMRGARFRFLEGADGLTGAQAALAYVLGDANVSCAVVGTTRLRHLMDNVAASGKRLSAATLARIHAVQAVQAGRWNGPPGMIFHWARRPRGARAKVGAASARGNCMELSPLIQMLIVAVLAYGAGLLLGLSFYRGEIGRDPGRAPARSPVSPVLAPVQLGSRRRRRNAGFFEDAWGDRVRRVLVMIFILAVITLLGLGAYAAIRAGLDVLSHAPR
jgi:hypothetical protein